MKEFKKWFKKYKGDGIHCDKCENKLIPVEHVGKEDKETGLDFYQCEKCKILICMNSKEQPEQEGKQEAQKPSNRIFPCGHWDGIFCNYYGKSVFIDKCKDCDGYTLKKPSDRIKEIHKRSPSINDKDGYILAIIQFLDEAIPRLEMSIADIDHAASTTIDNLCKRIDELEKQKFACPNCHRLVDELIHQIGRYHSILADGTLLPIEWECKHCAPKEESNNE